MTDLPEQISPVRFGALPAARADVLQRALARACQAGGPAALAADGPPDRVLQEADVVVSLCWPVTNDDAALRARLADAAHSWATKHTKTT